MRLAGAGTAAGARASGMVVSDDVGGAEPRAPVQHVDQRALLSWAASFAPELPPAREQQSPPSRRPSTSSSEDPAGAGAKGTAARRRAEQRLAQAEEARRRRARLAVKHGLKDGTVVLRILMEIFPTAAEALSNHLQENPTNRHAVSHNWKCIDACVAQLELPPSTVDRAGLSVARDKATNTILATLYFLHQLKHRPNFTAAFAFRLGEPIEDYLQSGRSLTSLARGGAVPNAAHLRQPLVFDAEVPAELTDPQWLWRNGAGNAQVIHQASRRQRAQQMSGPAPTRQAVRRAQPKKVAASEKRPPQRVYEVPESKAAPPVGRIESTVPPTDKNDEETTSESAPELSGGERLLTEEQQELVYLRKLRKVHTKQIKAMTESNNTLQLMVQKLEATIEQQAVDSATRSTNRRGKEQAADEAAFAVGQHRASAGEDGATQQQQDPQQRLFQRQVDEAREAERQNAEKLEDSEAAQQALSDEKLELETQLVRLAEAHGKLEKAHADNVMELECTNRELIDCKETCEMLELELRERTETLDEVLRQQPPPHLQSDQDVRAAEIETGRSGDYTNLAQDEPAAAAAHEEDRSWGRRQDEPSELDPGMYHPDDAMGVGGLLDAAAREAPRNLDFEAEVAALRMQAEQAIAGLSTEPADQPRTQRSRGSGSSASSYARSVGSSRSANGVGRAVRFKSECVVCGGGDGEEDATVRIALQRPAKSLTILRLEEKRGRYLPRQRRPWQSVFRGSTRRKTGYARNPVAVRQRTSE